MKVFSSLSWCVASMALKRVHCCYASSSASAAAIKEMRIWYRSAATKAADDAVVEKREAMHCHAEEEDGRRSMVNSASATAALHEATSKLKISTSSSISTNNKKLIIEGSEEWDDDLLVRREKTLLVSREQEMLQAPLSRRQQRKRNIENLKELSDLRFPHLWFPNVRSRRRRIIAHVGSTNSGKTYSALQRLREADRGVYCGPLRLLAWEVYEKLNAAGVPCDLVTGQERTDLGAQFVSCSERGDIFFIFILHILFYIFYLYIYISTRFGFLGGDNLFSLKKKINKSFPAAVEMTDLSSAWDVAVVDEVQLCATNERG